MGSLNNFYFGGMHRDISMVYQNIKKIIQHLKEHKLEELLNDNAVYFFKTAVQYVNMKHVKFHPENDFEEIWLIGNDCEERDFGKCRRMNSSWVTQPEKVLNGGDHDLDKSGLVLECTCLLFTYRIHSCVATRE
ncbi:hypothetical protein CEXT_756201 [Caerostris extrusa]|uniref:Uncharacterized protein n=1 Tax=Caerostris extrusa TaxID=172846 RepID=A0AAV4RMU2_CAEEX|nr:hypothetical protein CEXT_756201 [Caerostris extrusa]